MEEVKKGKKKNKVASLLLALALILTCGVAGTIAQYQKSLGGTGTANVASFKVDAQYNGTTIDKSQNLPLFDTILDTTDGANETDVVQSNGKAAKIAPGTVGYFQVDLSNSSDVTVEYQLYAKWSDDVSNVYKVTYTDSDGHQQKDQPIPIKFALYKGSKAPNITDLKNLTFQDISQLNMPTSGGSKATDSYGDLGHTTDKTATVFLCWEWEYQDSGKTQARTDLDTAIGEQASTLKPMVEVGVQFTQKD